ncbi:MAG: PaaI family thioesterase [Leptospiraceae bacterium]|nr:PaaI family thioesterase [Leptospiraceae bacterium]
MEPKRVANLTTNSCFACGNENPVGLKLVFYRTENKIFTKYFIDKKFVGWENLTHGGILTTILDEVMAWTAIELTKKFMLTKSFQVEFLNPVPAGQEITAHGKIVEWKNEREIVLETELRDSNDIVCVRATGNLILYDLEGFKKKKFFSDLFLEDFQKKVLETSS